MKITVKVLLLVLFLSVGQVQAAESIYPVTVKIIEKVQADYLTPENTLSAIRSCLFAEDLDWCDETSTRESLQKDIQSFAEANIDRRKIFELEKGVRETLLVNKIVYKDAVLLIVEDYTVSGSISQFPVTFIKEDGLWKQTNRYEADDELLQHLYYVPPLFYGKGQKPDDVNSFLGYEQPKQDRLELEAGVTSYTMHVYYSKTVDPQTFSATLNRKDISTMFSPAPYTDQEIEIPLVQGQNTLVLSIEGVKKDGKEAVDKDRLVFVVP